MTLEDVLKKEKGECLTLVNKNADLNRQVLTVESTENPDAFPYLEMNSIVITTAMVFKNDPKGLREFIIGLNQRPCAALAIKIGRYLDKIEEEVVRTADGLGFPLFIIPPTETLGRVYQSLLAILWNVKTREILEAQQIKRKLYRLFLNGATLRRMQNMISSTLNRHVLLFDMLGGGIYENGMATEEEVERALRVMGQLETRNVLWPAVKNVDGSQMLIYPIEFIRENTYFFIIFDNHPGSSMMVMEEILLMIGTMLYKSLYVIYNEIWKGNRFLNRMISINKSNWSISQILSEGKEYGLKLSLRYQIVIGKFIELDKYKFNNIQLTYREEKYISSFQSLKKIFSKLYYNKIVVLGDMDNWQYVLLIQGSCEGLHPELEKISRRIDRVISEKLLFFEGGMCHDITEAAASYWEVNDRIIRRKEQEGDRVVGYKAKNVSELLKEIPLDQSRKICQEMLKELAYPDNEFHKELRKTLEAYLECGCSITETTRKLFIHRNTVRYRIKKCEEILGMEISVEEPYFDLQLCLKLSEKT